MNLTVKNISNADDETLKEFYFEIDSLNSNLVSLINRRNLKIIFADKISDVINEQALEEIYKYSERYSAKNYDKTIRGICSDNIEGGSICIFSNNAKSVLGAILYHEIGHLVDCCKDFKTPIFSTSQDFIEAYKKDLNANWQKIKSDNRYRLIHCIQNSTPDKPDELALMETFAHCFARSFNKLDDVDIIGQYFENCLKITKEIIENFKK